MLRCVELTTDWEDDLNYVSLPSFPAALLSAIQAYSCLKSMSSHKNKHNINLCSKSLRIFLSFPQRYSSFSSTVRLNVVAFSS